MKDFLIENYKLIILAGSCLIELVLFAIAMFKKKRLPVLAAVLEVLPTLIVKGEGSGLKGQEKKEFVLNLAVSYMASLIGCDEKEINKDGREFLSEKIEEILETPQKKGQFMKSRQRVRKSVDRKIFRKTAMKTHSLNVPGRVMQRGGTRL